MKVKKLKMLLVLGALFIILTGCTSDKPSEEVLTEEIVGYLHLDGDVSDYSLEVTDDEMSDDGTIYTINQATLTEIDSGLSFDIVAEFVLDEEGVWDVETVESTNK